MRLTSNKSYYNMLIITGINCANLLGKRNKCDYNMPIIIGIKLRKPPRETQNLASLLAYAIVIA